MKQILVAVTGASPQILTETLYALHTQGKSFPDEMYVITTQNSKQMLLDGLYNRGHLQALYDEYDLTVVKFDESHIWVIEDEEGNLIDDAKSEEDQTFMADFITRKVAWLTNQENIVIHASIAGGRKTMAFYMGYAMSLLGREQDSLSHVFVNDEFEFVKDFYFPTLNDNWIAGKKVGDRLNTKDAEVTLAEIPFVRMRKSISTNLIEQIDQASFSKTVARMNSASQITKAVVSYKAKVLTVLGIDIKLTAKELAMYLYIASQTNKSILVDRDFIDSIEPSQCYLHIYNNMKADIRVYKTFGLEDDISWHNGELADLKPMEKSFIQPIISNINKKLEAKIPVAAYEKVSIHSEKLSGGNRYWIDSSLQVES